MLNLLFTILVASAEPTMYRCVTETGDVGKLIFRGSTREEAMYRSAKMCLSLRIQNYMQVKLNPPSDERRILFMEDCVNHTFCKVIDGNEK